jgi:hypothetical protein
LAGGRSYRNRLSELWRIHSSQPYQNKLRSKSPDLHPVSAKRGEFIIVAGESQIVKPGDTPNGIVFRDESFLVVYEMWSTESDSLLRYKYHYQRPDGWFVRYDMHETEQVEGHPKHHLQANVLDENVRLPTGEVACEDVLQMVVEQFVDANG